MKHESLSPPAAPADAHVAGPRWTNHTMAEFLRALAATHSVKAAAKSVGMSRQSAYRLRARLKGRAFDAAWNEAFHHSYANLPYLALERAMHGISVPHYYKGEVVGTSRRFDERLTVALLKLFNQGDALIVAGLDPAPAHTGARLEALLGGIEEEGEAAVADPALRADSSAASCLSDDEILAEFRRFGRTPGG